MICSGCETCKKWTNHFSEVVKVRKSFGDSPSAPVLTAHHDDVMGVAAQDPGSGALHCCGTGATMADGGGYRLWRRWPLLLL